MNISSKSKGFELSAAVNSFVREEVQSSLMRFSEDIVSVDVFMSDTNGPKGGVDMQVIMRIQMRARQQITLQTTRENLYAAVRVSTKRAKRAVRRSVRKARRFDRRSLRYLAVDLPGQEI